LRKTIDILLSNKRKFDASITAALAFAFLLATLLIQSPSTF